jgi:HK97 gp10 family phage protein
MSAVFIRSRVTGYEEAYQTLKNVADVRERQNIMRGAVRQMARAVEKAARPEIPVRRSSEPRKVPGFAPLQPGALRSALKTRVKVRRGNELSKAMGAFGVAGYVVAGDRKRGIYWAHFVEKGTRPHSNAKNARMGRRGNRDRNQDARRGHPGTSAVKFMERAVQSTEALRARLFADYIEKRLAKLARTGRGD